MLYTGCLTTLKNKFPVDFQDFPDFLSFPGVFTIPYKYNLTKANAMKKHVVIGSDHSQLLCCPSTANILINIIE